MRLNKKYILAIISILINISVYCQPVYDTIQLSEFEIVSNNKDLGLPLNITSIDSIYRNDINLQSVGELLALYTPVFVKSYGRGSVSTVSFRGTGSRHTKVVWEGFDINSPMLGQTDFSTIPISIFDDIELSYGGSSLSEIGGALGGSINLNTSCNLDTENQVSISQSIGSFNTFMTAAELRISTNKLGSKTHIIQQSSLNDFTYYNNAILPYGKTMKQGNADFKNRGFTQQLDYRINQNQTISLITWNQWNNRDIPAIMTNIEKGGQQNEWQKGFFSRSIASWDLNSGATHLSGKVAYFYEDMNYFLQTTDTIGSPISTIDSKNNVQSLSLSADIKTSISSSLQLKGSLKYINQIVNSNNYYDLKIRNIASGLLGIESTLSAKFRSEVLVRVEVVDGKVNPIMPMIGISFKPLDNSDLFFRVNISRNYNLPSLNDMYWYPGGNDSLNPEQSIESEFSMEYVKVIKGNHKLTLRNTLYYANVSNWIMWQPGDYRYWTPSNIDNVISKGLELSFKASGTVNNIQYNLLIEYAYTKATKDDISGSTQLMYVPLNTFNSFARIGFKGYYFNWGIHLTGKRSTCMSENKNYSAELPAYTLHNISLGKRGTLNKAIFDVKIRVYNIFNKDYQSILWRAMPRRNFELCVGLKI